MERRLFLKSLACSATAGLCLSRQLAGENKAEQLPPNWQLAVQQYTFNRQLRSGELKLTDYPRTVVEGTGIKALEYFNGHMEDRAGDTALFRELRRICDDLGAVNTLMLCRSKFALDSSDEMIRQKAIESYRPWLEATKILGGDYIRVDVRSPGDYEQQQKFAATGLRDLCKVAAAMDMGILVENHGNFSSNGTWVAEVMKAVDQENCGTLPDFQNFVDYDPYQGVREMMPWAKIVCAKSKAFDDNGNETNIDYRKMLNIVYQCGFSGYIGIEFEGHEISPIEGILATKKLIEKVMAELA